MDSHMNHEPPETEKPINPDLDKALDFILTQRYVEIAGDREKRFISSVERVSLNLPDNPRIAFYVRAKRKFDPTVVDVETSIAEKWIPHVGILQETINDDADMTILKGFDFNQYDLIITPDIHQFGDTLAEALNTVRTLPCPVYFEKEALFSCLDPQYCLLCFIMYEETDITDDYDEESNPVYLFNDEIMQEIIERNARLLSDRQRLSS